MKTELILVSEETTCADHSHPGYGFLSRRKSFAKAFAEAGIASVWPPPNAFGAMGDEIESRKLAKQAGTNVVQGFLGEIRDTEPAAEFATGMSFPVTIKASAGGGGNRLKVTPRQPFSTDLFPSSCQQDCPGPGRLRRLAAQSTFKRPARKRLRPK